MVGNKILPGKSILCGINEKKKKTYDKKIANCSQAESSKMTRNGAACQRALALGKSPASQRINKHV